MKKVSMILIIMVGIILVVVSTLSTSAKSTNLCNQCHSSYSQYLDILEGNTGEVIPQTIGVSETKTVTIQISNQCNARSYTTLTNVRLTLSSKNGLFKVTNPTYTVGTMSTGTKSATWQIIGVAGGSDELTITAQGSNTHNKLTFRDTYSPAKAITITVLTPPPTYTVLVAVKDSNSSNPLMGANVNLGETLKTTASDGTTTFTLEAGSYTLELSKSGYTTSRETLTINGATTITRSIAQASANTYLIKVNVSDSNAAPIQSANVTITGVQTLTDLSGQTSFNLKPGTYTITISKQGYLTLSEALIVSSNSIVSKTLTLIPPKIIYTKILVTDSTTQDPIISVEARLGGKLQQTDINGSTIYTQPAGEYLLELTKKGYISYAENVSITGNVTINRSLDPEQTTIGSTPLMVYIHPPIAIAAYLLIFTFTVLLYVNVGSRSIVWVGFSAWILSILGMVTGMIWAVNAWGSYWSWEPRESAMLAITVLVSFMMIAHIEKRFRISRFFALISCTMIVMTQQAYFLVAGVLAIIMVVVLRSDFYLSLEKPKRYAALMKLNRDLSWVFITESIVTLFAGYVMTRLGVDPATTLVIHTYLGYTFVALLLTHIVLSFTYPYPWLGYIRSLRRRLTANTLIGVVQESSAILLIVVALGQFITGVSWLSPSLASLVPLRLHVDLDNALLYILIVHGAVGVRAVSIRGRWNVPGGNLAFLLITVFTLITLAFFQYLNIL